MVRNIIVFDLDDTLCQELEYLKSAYQQIARLVAPDVWDTVYVDFFNRWQAGEDVFAYIESKYSDFNKDFLLNTYRTHLPDISLEPSVYEMIEQFVSDGCVVGVITDGRVVTQTNKIKALKLDELIDPSNIYISEQTGFSKPNPFSYSEFERRYPNCRYYYVADNVKKDFVAPNTMGWTTIGLKDNGNNIHKCEDKLPREYQPNMWIDNLIELKSIINNNE